MTDNKKGYWLILDSYPETNEEVIQQNMKEFNLPRETAKLVKKLAWNYPFFFAKNYFIDKAPEKKSFTLIKSLIKLFEWLKSKIIHS